MKQLKSKLSVITGILGLVLFASLLSIGQPAITTVVVNWTVPSVVSAQALQDRFVSFLDTYYSQQTDADLSVYNRGCLDWTTNAYRNRDLGLAQQPKPIQPAARHFTVKQTSVSLSRLEMAVTETRGPELAGKTCPDLPPVPPVIPNNVVFGVSLGNGFYASGQGDTVSVGSVVSGPDGKVYQKIGLPPGVYAYCATCQVSR